MRLDAALHACLHDDITVAYPVCERARPVRLCQHAQEVQASIDAGALCADLDAAMRLEALAGEAAAAEAALLRQAPCMLAPCTLGT